MAIRTNNGPKANPGEIKQALNFLKELLPNSLVRLVGILLHPCCDLEITDFVVTCNEDAGYDIVFTLGNPLSYSQSLSATVSNTSGGEITVSEDGKTVTATGVDITSVPSDDVPVC
jgi:hypothetical protein